MGINARYRGLRQLAISLFLLAGCERQPPATSTSPRLPSPEVESTAAFDAGLRAVLPHYLTIQQALAADRLDGVQSAGREIAALAAKLDASAVTGADALAYKSMPKELERLGKELGRATRIEDARTQLGALSVAMSAWMAGARPAGIDMAYCPMAQLGWFQKKGPIDNPYYGNAMRTCGEIVSAGP